MSTNGTQTPQPNRELAVRHENYIEELGTLFTQSSDDRIDSLRKKGFERFRELGLPSLKWEDWKYFSLKNILPESVLPYREERAEKAKELADPNIFESPYRLYLKNGRYCAELSHLPEGVEVTPMEGNHVLDEDLTWLENDGESTDPFEALNLALFQTGLHLTFPKDWSSTEPLVLLHDFDSEATNRQIPTRVHAHVGAFSKVQIIEHFLGEAEELSFFCNHQTRLQIDEGANVTHIKYSQLPDKTLHMGSTIANVEKAANLKSFTMTLSRGPHRHNLHIRLLDDEAHAQVDGLYTLRGQDHVDHFSIVDHRKSHTSSNQLFKGILDDKARGAFTGKMIVERHAQKVEASQLNKNLLLSKKAKVDTRPQLEVYADDVSCEHGATVGQISQEELFYLESRGIPRLQAYGILCHAFATDVISRLENERLESWLMKQLYEGYERFSEYGKFAAEGEDVKA